MRYLLCVPQAGLTDILTKIEFCLEYCQKYNRILLIDTQNSYYNISFHDLFEFREANNNVIYDYMKILEIKQRYHIIPSYKLINDFEEECIEFNNKIGYYACPLKLLNRLYLTDTIIDEILNRYNKITKPYISFHIRNTDYFKCDYEKCYEVNKDVMINNNNYIATDNLKVLQFFMDKPELTVFNFTSCLNDKEQPIHMRRTQNDKKIVILDTICDLILLSLGSKFIKHTHHNGGYNSLAYKLFLNKTLVKKLLKDKI